MQSSAAEDLLENVENLAVAVGDVLVTAASTNATDNTNRTIEKDNISTYVHIGYHYVPVLHKS